MCLLYNNKILPIPRQSARAENESNEGKWNADNSRWKQAVEQDRSDVRDAEAANWDKGSQRQGYDSRAAGGQVRAWLLDIYVAYMY